MVEAVRTGRLTWKEAAASFQVSERTVAKWLARKASALFNPALAAFPFVSFCKRSAPYSRRTNSPGASRLPAKSEN